MSGSVTPARRAREDDESEIEEYEVSVDGEGSPRSSASKRRRLDDEDNTANNDEVSESEDGNVLPDSYRRSPKGKGRAMNVPAKGHAQNEHQPGSIVRVTLTNFVTYTKAEFHLGPNLNMIIGPNGTGKSTLVCAICLGLGWATSHLGRAKDLGEFVKHGAKRATIEIELAADPAHHSENQVITTKIMKNGNKAEYTINNKKSNKKGVQMLARSFSIQVDNLCQFLPQDRVVEFAALSPVDLLTQTQRAAAPEEMSRWHDELKDMRKDQKRYEQDQQRTVEILKADKVRQRAQEADVERLRERTGLLQRSKALEKLRPLPQYQAARKKFDEAKERLKEADKELRHLNRRLEPNLQAVREKEEYLEKVDQKRNMRKKLVERSEVVVKENKASIENDQGDIDELYKEIESEKKANSKHGQKMPKLLQDLAEIQRAMQSPPPPFDAAEFNEQIRQKTRESRDLKDEKEEVNNEMESLKIQYQQHAKVVNDLVNEQTNLQSQAGQQVNKLKCASKDAAAAWDWIEANRKTAFKSEVYGPAIIECKVKNPKDADIVESVIREGEKLAFTVTSHEDFKMLQEQLYGKMKLSQINIRNSTQLLSSFHPPIPDQNLQQHGLQGWVLDLLEGPDAVKAMLCDNQNIHQTAYARREVSSDEFSALQRSPLSSWITPTQSYVTTRRRDYGEQAASTRVQAVRKAKYFTDAPIDHQASAELQQQINEANGEVDLIRQQLQELKEKGKNIAARHQKITEEETALKADKMEKQRALTGFNGLHAKEQAAQAKIEETKTALFGHKEQVKGINDKIDGLTTVKGQHCLNYANAVESMRGLYIQLYEAEIIILEATSDLEQLKAQHAEEERLLEERRQEVNRLTLQKNRLHQEGIVLRERCAQLELDLNEYENDVKVEIMQWQPEQMQTEIESVLARLEMTAGAGGENTLREYEQRAKRIEEKLKSLEEIEASLEGIGAKITDVRDQWEPRLDALVSQISDAFAENFARIQCAGEVTVHKDDDFEQWSIEIKVKFRENEQLSVLDSHRQSGGERAVSTIFYLMALQSLARSPFRVVDEINQGMDPRNERLVHSRMVDIACAEHTSQYFLITPKLLNGLKYHENMKVHCIASGDYMPEDHRELDFGMLAQKALAMRAGSGGGVRVAG